MSSLICDRYILLWSILDFMTTKLLIAMQDSVLTLEYSKTKTNWKIHECLKGTHPQYISSDPSKRNRMYIYFVFYIHKIIHDFIHVILPISLRILDVSLNISLLCNI
jgi:hypothetical protein